jgi:hypothetical protein
MVPFDPGAAQRVVDWFREKGWIGPQEGAVQIIERSMYCKGCPGDRSIHWSPDCPILKCCVDERKLRHCSECEEFPCSRLNEWAGKDPKYSAALKRLTEMRADGGR